MFGEHLLGMLCRTCAEPREGKALSKIEHCGVKRAAKACWLLSQEKSYQWEILLIGHCRQCDKTLYEVFGYHLDKGAGERVKIKPRQVKNWLQRVKTDLDFVVEAEQQGRRETRQVIFVGDYTKRISRGIVYGQQ